MKIISNLLKGRRDEWLAQTTASINEINPIVDRIMDDESVEVVVMANDEGLPILTNVNVICATLYSTAMHRLGTMIQKIVKEMDPFDEALVFRLKTNKTEVMVAPQREFDVLVVQHARVKRRQKTRKQRNADEGKSSR